MTQEEKQLLLIDLCARIPYSQIVNINGEIKKLIVISNTFIHFADLTDDDLEGICDLDYCDIKPYLRPMSSMTEEERKELSDYLCERVMSDKSGITIPPNPTHGKGIGFDWMGDCIDWLNKYHFDYRGLIEMGLAYEAPKGMYK